MQSILYPRNNAEPDPTVWEMLCCTWGSGGCDVQCACSGWSNTAVLQPPAANPPPHHIVCREFSHFPAENILAGNLPRIKAAFPIEEALGL